MIIKSPEKHLTDQEFFSYIKFFGYVMDKKDLDDGLDTFNLRDLQIGSDEEGYIFNRIEMSGQLLKLDVAIEKGYKFAKEVEDARAEAMKKPKKSKRSSLRLSMRWKSKSREHRSSVMDLVWHIQPHPIYS